MSYALAGFPVPPIWRTYVQVHGSAGLQSPTTIYAGRSRDAAFAHARSAAQKTWPVRTLLGILTRCPASWIGQAWCYACLQKLTALGWVRAPNVGNACTTSSYLGASP